MAISVRTVLQPQVQNELPSCNLWNQKSRHIPLPHNPEKNAPKRKHKKEQQKRPAILIHNTVSVAPFSVALFSTRLTVVVEIDEVWYKVQRPGPAFCYGPY